MHGKISYYGDKSGTGTITNQNKRIFEFTKKSWHDFKSLPTPKMYVDFRTDDSNRVVSARESSFKRLSLIYGVSEEDFWESSDDVALEERAKDLKDERINFGLKKLNPKNPIKPTKSIDECFDIYFFEQIELIYRYEELLVDPKKYKSIDYFKLKRFLQKAKTQLLQSDTSISYENFSEIEQELKKLEHLIAQTIKDIKVDSSVMFESVFLDLQINYHKTKRRIQRESERVFELEGHLKKSKYDIERLRNLEQNSQKSEEKLSYTEKIKTILNNRKLWKKEIEFRQNSIKLFNSSVLEFEKKYFSDFISGYNFENEEKKIYSYLKTIVDYVAFVFDSTIWNLATKSKSIQNSFYTFESVGSYNAFTFLRHYLKPLDKMRLNAQDKALFSYLNSYDHKACKKFLIISDNKELSLSLKSILFECEKDSLVFNFNRAIDSMQWIKQNSFHILLLDTSITSLSLFEFLKFLSSVKKGDEYIVIAIADQDQKETLLKLKELGIKIFIKRPIVVLKFKELISKIV